MIFGKNDVLMEISADLEIGCYDWLRIVEVIEAAHWVK